MDIQLTSEHHNKKTIPVHAGNDNGSSPHEGIVIHNPHPTNKTTQPEKPHTRKKRKKKQKTRQHSVKNVNGRYLNSNPKAQRN
jgi:hypothetical protein